VFSTDDTIVAVATPAGHGGLGVVRLSGPAAVGIATALTDRVSWQPRRAVRATVHLPGTPADTLITCFSGPASYTGEDVVEIAAHGNPLLLAAIVERAVECGARPARAGEFTLRAFVRGKLDLVQAEAVRDLVEASTPAQLALAARHLEGSLSARIRALASELRRLEVLLEASVDFPDEGYRFVDGAALAASLDEARRTMTVLLGDDARAGMLRHGASVVITGAPNVGKSSLFNALLASDRSIVTPTPGTTRDLVSERAIFGGVLVRLVDSAGLRDADDLIEAEGVRRASEAAASADLLVLVLDRSTPLDDEFLRPLLVSSPRRLLVVANKCDRPAVWADGAVPAAVLSVSATTGDGVVALGLAIAEALRATPTVEDHEIVSNPRQRAALREALRFVAHACAALDRDGAPLPEEFVLEDLRGALGALDDVVGRRSTEDLLGEIFGSFCIGK
jgi:tRNA modification GTPase